ncbi:MAG: hypothetical protein R3E13_07760 [Alphaproteobacteria bacterium]
MRLELVKLLEKLGVSRKLSPYETNPWFLYDEEKALTCSAEVRMGPTSEDIEAEIQILHDEKDDESESTGEGGDTAGTILPGGREQILQMRCEPVTDNKWTVKHLNIKGTNYENEFHEWEEKGCEFFLSCVEALQMGQLPDFDTLAEDKMKDDSMWGGGSRGRVGRKSPKIKPASLLGMKKP